MEFIYKKSVLGGTFDHLHIGHQKLLDKAFESSEHVTIGLAESAIFDKKILAQEIESYEIRQQKLERYLEKKNLLERATIIPIHDIFGTTLEEKNIDAIFATADNKHNVETINTQRKEHGFPQLKMLLVPLVIDKSGVTVSSERIRKGEIDRQGFVYRSIFENNRVFYLPDDLRKILQEPIGMLVKETKDVLPEIKGKTVIAVGDIIFAKLKEAGVLPALGIIDFKTRRHELPQDIHKGIKAVNKQGTLNSETALTVEKTLNYYFETHASQIIIVDGEEDLLALPALLLSPLGTIVVYGQFDQGVVINEVTEKMKQKIQELLGKFV